MAATPGVWMLRFKPDDNCNGDPISLHASKQNAELELKKYSPASIIVIEWWPVLP